MLFYPITQYTVMTGNRHKLKLFSYHNILQHNNNNSLENS